MHRLWWCIVVLVVAGAAPAVAVVGGTPASPPEPDAAVVFVQRFGRSARLQGVKDDTLGYYSFFGIRYAQPPLGSRRFQRPERYYIGGEMNATVQCPPCPQRDPYVPSRVMGHEDCLCLNVFAPKMPGDERGCPVVLFIHGGNYQSGSTASYGGQHLARKDTILVTVQYRLGSLGYLSTDQRDAAGNLGLFDIHTARSWISDYIEFFGGDKNRVVVMGQGSGGSAASLMAMSSEGRSYSGVAALSGAPLSPGAVRPDPAKHADTIAERTGCPKRPAERLIKCLRKLPFEKIVLADEDLNMENTMETMKFLNEISGRSGTGARVEGEDDLRALPPLVSEKPADTLKRKNKRPPMLTGVTSAETARAVFGKFNKFLTNQLQEVNDFIKKDLIGGLQGVVQGVDGLLSLSAVVQTIVPIPLPEYYQAAFNATRNVIDGLSQIVEATGDALFNFPAYQSVKAWSSSGPAFLYNFEHIGNLSKGSHFLPGLALTDPTEIPESEKKMIKGPAHGDELAYIFEPLDPGGKSAGCEVSSTDARVRDSFVDLISKFAHGQDSAAETKNGPNFLGFLPFSEGNEQFLKISNEITTEKDFRFCQMGIWGNMKDRLTGALCENLIGNLLKQLPIVGQLPIVDQLPGVEKLPIVSQLPNVGQPPLNKPFANSQPLNTAFGLLGGRSSEPPRAIQQTRATSRQPDFLGLFNRQARRLPYDF